jgi:catechol 2,3-dioxygenase-like lactoylglutathione lyase family enzyme
MKRPLALAWLMISIGAFGQTPATTRPKIIGIDHVAFYTTSPDANRRLYMHVLGLASFKGSPDPVEPGQIERFIVGSQWVEYSPAPDPKATDRMDHLAFRTVNCDDLRSYLAANRIRVPQACADSKDGTRSFTLKDPEGHRVEFTERPSLSRIQGTTGDAVSPHLIHAGFIVHDRAAEDHFYKDILGFRLYWYGGMKPERTDWVAMQVPDGTDWLEYMLNQPANPDLELSGVMNHISLGVKNMKAAQAKLESYGWKPHGEEHSQMGKDGKWQLNLFDPDFTRVELMEFTPAQKPCCSEFQGPHPTE